MYIFVSQSSDVVVNKNQLAKICKNEFRDAVIINSDFTDYIGNDIEILAERIKLLSKADVVIFPADWKSSKRCRIERLIADEYKIKTFVMEEM